MIVACIMNARIDVGYLWLHVYIAAVHAHRLS